MKLETTPNLECVKRCLTRLRLRQPMAQVQASGAPAKVNYWQSSIRVRVEGIVTKHPDWCAIHEEDGPCTCGTEDVLDEIALEEAGLTEEDFE